MCLLNGYYCRIQKKKPEIKSKQVRARVTSTISDFVKKDGIYHKHLQKMCFHRFHVIMLGSQMAIKIRTEECMTNSLYISIQRDFLKDTSQILMVK